MLSTGNQLRAARALLDMDQGTLAKAADVNVNTIRNMEASKDETIGANNQTMVAVQKALERAGVEFLNHDQPGVRLKPRRSGK
jgi:DNA-binding XRE family transcriptional regulator